MAKLYNLARMTTTTTGGGTITLGVASSGFLTFAQAGVVDQDIVFYGIKDGANSEVGYGTYTASGATLTRNVIRSTNSNAAISLSGGAEVYVTVPAELFSPSGHVNKLRNSSLISWFHGSSVTVTTSGGWGAEGIYVLPTGAGVTAAQSTNGVANPLTVNSLKITGNTSVTDVLVRFVIESNDAAALAGQTVVFQVPVLNNTGASITPTITVKHATAGQDNYSTTATDVSAASLQTIANGATGTLAYAWNASAASSNGISVTVDFGNNFSTNAKSIQIGGGFDCRVSPNSITGQISVPPTPDIRDATTDMLWNHRFFFSTYENGVAPGTNVVSSNWGGMAMGNNAGSTGVWGAQYFPVPMRAAPTISAWDRTGAAGKSSYYNGTWSDTHGTFATLSASTKGFLANTQTGNMATDYYHYTADATLTGA